MYGVVRRETGDGRRRTGERRTGERRKEWNGIPKE